jgi:sulfite oxidase
VALAHSALVRRSPIVAKKGMSESGRVFHDAEDLNSGERGASLAEGGVTPVARFFRRNHASPPDIDPADWRLAVDGMVESPLSLPLAELQAFPHHELTATLLCAGLRRDELQALGSLRGELPWGIEPASTARWTGVRLHDVLVASRVLPSAAHIHVEGLDRVTRHGCEFGFGGSIAYEKAMSPEVMLAFAMNGEPLSQAHGFPLRLIVPGWIGARSVKWLGRVSASREPSSNYFQTHAYRVQRDGTPDDPGDVTMGTPLSEITLNSVIVEPSDGARIKAGGVMLRGWAIGAAARTVTQVECSSDGGVRWHRATLEPHRSDWSWTQWHLSLNLPAGQHTIVVRAQDESGTAQPATLREAWNVKGYLNNAWHRVVLTVE